ncbi:MAG TPA: T9SS type A sorting domain-containing protein [Candidatus Cloacimonadota bacterium]|nr:T9SS type A sorting domain-containing protein [Candidatus Cloacimonadota bacterium]
MKKLMLFIVALLAAGGILSAELAWPQPVSVVSYDNVNYHSMNISLQTYDGCHLLTWWQNDNGVTGFKLCLFDGNYQPLWDEPLALGPYMEGMVETSDQGFVVATIPYSVHSLRVLKISRTGEYLWGQQGVPALDAYMYVNNEVTMAADHNGGVYVASYGTENSARPSVIQHLDATGARTIPGAGWSMGVNWCSGFSDLMVLPDNSMIVSWSNNTLNTVNMQRVSPTGQNLWSQPVTITGFSWGKICAFADDSFALFMYSAGIEAQRFDYSGSAIWPQPVSVLTQTYRGTPALGPDGSIFFSAVSYVQKINPNGATLYGNGINLGAVAGTLSEITQPMPDNAGGCSVVGIRDDNPKNVVAFHVDAAGALTHQYLTDSYDVKQHPTAHRYGYNIGVEWHETAIRQKGIKVQILDQQLQPQLDPNGMGLLYSDGGSVQDLRIFARANGCAVTWQQGTTSQTNPNWDLYLQIYTSGGQSVLGNGGIKINRPGYTPEGSRLVRCKSNETLVLWTEQLNGVAYQRYQVFSETGNIMLPEGGLPVGMGGHIISSMDIGTYLDDWYMVGAIANTIWCQKMDSNTYLWEDVFQITQAPPGLTNDVTSLQLNWPWMTWAVGNTRLVACLDADFHIRPGFPLWGMDLPTQYESANIYGHRFNVIGENLHALLNYSRYVDYDYLDYIAHTMINSQGSVMFPLQGVMSIYTYSCNVFTFNGLVCVGYYANGYYVREYDTSGELVGTHRIIFPGFGVDGVAVLGISNLSDGNLLLMVFATLDNQHTIMHMYLTPQWNLVQPVDRIVLNTADNTSLVAFNGDRAWAAALSGYDYYGSYKYATINLQGVKLAGSPNPDSDPQVPELPYLERCSPNPFNPSTLVPYSLPESGPATIKVYDLRGRKVATLLDEYVTAGKHSVIWNGKDSAGTDVASGVYIMRLEAGEKQHTRKVTLMK